MIRDVAHIVAGLVGAALVLTLCKPVHAHDPYGALRTPGNPAVSCCNAQTPDNEHGDCRPTRAYVGEDGLWRALVNGVYVVVPRERELPIDVLKDGRAHICEKLGYIYCFSGSEIKS